MITMNTLSFFRIPFLAFALLILISCQSGSSTDETDITDDQDTQTPEAENWTSTVGTGAALELFGTFHSMGVTVDFDSDPDGDEDAVAYVEYRKTGSDDIYEGLPLTRVAGDRFVGSLFFLEPGTEYDVRVYFDDPDHGAIHLKTITGSMSTRVDISMPEPVTRLYVSPDGSGAECSQTHPCLVNAALGQVHAGYEVVLAGGTYYEGDMNLAMSGTDIAPIMIRSQIGEDVVFDGADPSLAVSWQNEGDGVYSTAINTDTTRLVIYNGKRLFPYDTLTALTGLDYGISGMYSNDGRLYIHLADDEVPSEAAPLVVSRFGTLWTLTGDHIFISGLTFRHYGQGEYPKVIYINGGSHNLIQYCVFESNDLGIGLKRESNGNVIQFNSFSETIFDWPWDPIKTVPGAGMENGGIVFYDPMNGRGTVIRYNTFHDDFDGFRVCSSYYDEADPKTLEVDVYENVIYHMGDDGMETDGDCSNVRIWNNTFHDVLMGISLAPARVGPTYAIGNLIYNTGVGNNDYTGSPFKFNSSGYGKSGAMYLFHNTCDAGYGGNNGLYIKYGGAGDEGWDLIYARNNIFSGTDYAMNDYHTSQLLDMDYDNLWNDAIKELVQWDSLRFVTLSDYTGHTGQESHGVSADPGFSDPEGGDYSLSSNSMCVDRGMVIPGINDGFSGAAPDLGAFERD